MLAQLPGLSDLVAISSDILNKVAVELIVLEIAE